MPNAVKRSGCRQDRRKSMTEHFKYEDMTDEELIDQLREGDRQVMDYICDKYKNLVRSKAKSMYILGGMNLKC